MTSQHFWAVSNASDSRSKRLLRNLEEFRWVFNRIYNPGDIDSVPIRVYIFKSSGSFRPFTPVYEGKPKNAAGFFQQGVDYHIIALDASVQNPLKTVFHEYVHFLTSRTEHPLPVWLSEGLAEFYSTFDIRGKEVVLGAPIPYHADLLKRKTLLPLSDFFKVGHSSPEYNERSKQGVFYAQSWALVHYLMMDDQASLRPQFVQLFNQLAQGVDFDTAFDATIPLPMDVLERNLHRYVNLKAVYTTLVKLGEIEAAEKIQSARLPQADAEALLGDLLLHSNRLEEAESYYQRARALDPDSPRVLEGLGLLELRRDNYSQAVQYLKGAAEADSNNFLVHFRYAEGLMSESGLLEGKEEVTEEEFNLISKHLRRAIELRPGYPHSFYLLGLLYHRTGQALQAGLSAMRRAIQLKPQEPHYRMALAELQLATKDRVGARATLDRLAQEDNFLVQRFVEAQLEYLNYLDQMDRMPAELTQQAGAQAGIGPGAPDPAPPQRPLNPWEQPAETGVVPEPGPDPDPDPGSVAPECRPAFASIRGVPRLPARLLRVECSDNLIYVAEIKGDVTRLIGPPGEVILFSCSVPLTQFECGPFQYDATVYFEPGWDKDPETGAFKVRAIEFR